MLIYSKISSFIILILSPNFVFKKSDKALSFSTTIILLGFFLTIFSVNFPVPGPISSIMWSYHYLIFWINFIAYINDEGSDLFLPNISEFGP